MPLVIYLGLHAITREPALILPSEQKQITLATLKVNDTAVSCEESGNGQHKGKQFEQHSNRVLLLETLTEDITRTIKQWLQHQATQHVTLVWIQPVAYIAAKLANGEGTENTLNEWQQMANATLNLFRQHRRQITLIGADVGVPPASCDEAALLTLPPAEHAPLFTLAASQLLASNSVMQETVANLRASSAWAYPQVEPDTDQVISTLNEYEKKCQQLNQYNRDIKSSEEKLDAERTAHQKAKKTLHDTQEKNQQHIVEQGKALASVKEENELVIAELHKVQETLEATLNERDASLEQTTELKKDKGTLQEKLSTEKKAHQKAKKTLHDTQEKNQQHIVEKGKVLASVREENELVIAELHRVQELLESKLIEREELVKQRDDARNNYEIAIQQRSSALYQLDQRFAQLQQTNLDLKASKNEIAEYQREQIKLYSRIDRYQTQLNVQKEEFQQALQEQSTWLTWVRCNAAHYSAVTYKHSRSHRKTLKQQAALVQASQHFDKQWYLEQYPDIANSTMDPVEHYLKYGVLEARNPSPSFDTKFYITQNPDIAESGYQPLLHYIQHGQMEHRQTKIAQLQLPSPQPFREEASSGENAQASQEAK